MNHKKTIALAFATISILQLSKLHVHAESQDPPSPNLISDTPFPSDQKEEYSHTSSRLPSEEGSSTLHALSISSKESKSESQPVESRIASSQEDFDFDPSSQTITKYTGDEKEVTIPSQINGQAVEHIGRQAFRGKNIKALNLPEGISSIGTGAFIQNNLTSMTLPSTTKILSDMALANNKNLSQVHLNEGLLEIGDRAFFGNSSLESLVLPDSLIRIGNLAFERTNLSGDLLLGSQLGHVGHRILNQVSKEVTIKIKAGEGNKLYLHDEIFQAHQNYLAIPQGREVMVFGRAFQNPGEVILDAGQIQVTDIKNRESIQALLKEKILLTSGFANIDRTSTDISQDSYIETPVSWDFDKMVYQEENGSYLLRGKFSPIDSKLYTMAGVNEDVTEAAMARLTPQVELIPLEASQHDSWTADDFEYGYFSYKPRLASEREIFGITSLSALGVDKVKFNQDLIIPSQVEVEENGQLVQKNIEGIGKEAFKDVVLNSLVIPESKVDFVIKESAFENSGLTSVSFKEGLAYIGSRAFMNNQLTEVSLPSTVWMTGNESFFNNDIERLTIHPLVESLQLDNFSFAHNQLTEVDLPYDIYKFRDYVFKGNPGVKRLDESELMANDPEGTGQVRLNTVNPKHLTVDSYIARSPYHEVINLAEGIKRDELFNLIKSGYQILDNPTYLDRQLVEKLEQALREAMDHFTNPKSPQSRLDQSQQQLQTLLQELEIPRLADLQDLIKQAQQVNPDIYSQESLDYLASEMEAIDLAMSTELSNENINHLIDRLDHALAELRLNPDLLYTREDFTFQDQTITGLSKKGIQKKIYNKDLVLPEYTPDNLPILEIGDSAFETREGVEYGSDTVNSPLGFKSVVLPKSITHIGHNAFKNNQLKEVDLPENLVSIGNTAFNGNQLERLILPDSLVEMGIGAFSLNQLKEVRLSPNMTSIPNGAFSRNIQLEKIEIPEGIKLIGQSAFIGAPLKQLTIPSSVEKIERMAFQTHRLKDLTIPGNVKEIANNAFFQNPKFKTLEKLTLEEGIESIGANAFAGGLLSELVLPESLSNLHANAFAKNVDVNNNPLVVTLYSKNPDQLAFNTARSKNNHLVILIPDQEEAEPNVDQESGSEEKHAPTKPDQKVKQESENAGADVKSNAENMTAFVHAQRMKNNRTRLDVFTHSRPTSLKNPRKESQKVFQEASIQKDKDSLPQAGSLAGLTSLSLGLTSILIGLGLHLASHRKDKKD